MTREVEISEANLSHLTFSPGKDSVTWILPASKTDVKALGTSRTWGCVCNGSPLVACPLHSLLAQHDFTSRLCAELGLEPDAVPLFPTQDGHRTTKSAAIATITKLATMIGQPTICPSSGGQLLGGHSLRTGGAQTLAGLGVDPMRIQSWDDGVVVWSSVTRWPKEAPALPTIPSEVSRWRAWHLRLLRLPCR